ncbi:MULTISPECIES: hypothetical protein [unclassified Yoonia]|uniref:hypothetical protein n=1 Tax=unclassified Yoonia TaxID=2629118 RepID=UPI002AFFEDE3|nr:MULTISPECIES: hypothetical protein [unclassified Yoonia]
MRDFLPEEDSDIERIIAAIGAPPAAPMVVVRQELERSGTQVSHGLFPRLIGVFMPKAGQ